jgi:type IV secretion system protein VirB6
LGIKSYPKIFNVAGITDANQAADEFAHAMNYVSGLYFSYAKKMSIWHFGECIFAAFTGLIILLVGYIFTAIALVIVVFAKIGVAVAMSFAPLALVMLMMEQTRGHFESWVKFLVGFFIIPMLTSSLMSLMVYAAGTSVDAIMTKSGASGTAGGMPDQFIPLVLLTFGALIFLSQIPTMASTLAGASVAAVGTSLASSQSLMNRARSIKGAAGAAASGGKRLRDAAGIGIAARKAGASAPRTAWAMISGMRQSALTRASRRDNRMGDRMPGTSNGGRNGPSTPPAAPEDGNTERNVYKP